MTRELAEANLALRNRRKRSRAESGAGEPIDDIHKQTQEAISLHYVHTGEKLTEDATDELARKRVRGEKLGNFSCGTCRSCVLQDPQPCLRARNRRLAAQGSIGAVWAETGEELVGRRFKVCNTSLYASHLKCRTACLPTAVMCTGAAQGSGAQSEGGKVQLATGVPSDTG